MKNEIVIFNNQNIKLEVNLKDESVWLNSNQIAELFDRDVKTIRKHINNALKEELNCEEVVANFATTTKHGAIEGKTQTHLVEYYNLDMIISVGYRVKSKRGVEFRKWANKVLKEHLLKGYSINQARLESLEKTVKLIDIASRSNDTSDVIQVINRYSRALGLLDDYDHRIISKDKGTISDKKITYDECMFIIDSLKTDFDSDIFALERNKGLESIINNIYQTFGGEDVYKSIEEKAANFLYMTVKNHVFIDGNKRIAATLFIYFLFVYNILYRDDVQIIDNNTLAALTILIAESNPKEKEIIVDLVRKIINN